MAHITAQVILPFSTLIPEDVSVNTFHFSGGDSASAMASAAKLMLLAFYNTNPPGESNPVKSLYAGNVQLTGTRIKVYNADDSEPRAPIMDEGLGVTVATALSSTNLPSEVAICSSYAADPASGSPAARRRGRIFLGPLNAGAGTTGGASPTRPSPAALSIISKASDKLATDSTAGCAWVVYSRADSAWRNITRGWVDDAFDTQRRRGQAATSRTTWTA